MREYSSLCESIPRYTRVFLAMREYPSLYESIPRYTRVSLAIREYPSLYESIPRHARVFSDIREYFSLYESIFHPPKKMQAIQRWITCTLFLTFFHFFFKQLIDHWRIGLAFCSFHDLSD